MAADTRRGVQEPEPGCGDQVADAAHTMNQTKAAFRLRIKQEGRSQGDLFEQATGSYAYLVVASHWPAEEKTAHEVLRWHNQRDLAENFNAVFPRIGVLAYNLFIRV